MSLPFHSTELIEKTFSTERMKEETSRYLSERLRSPDILRIRRQLLDAKLNDISLELISRGVSRRETRRDERSTRMIFERIIFELVMIEGMNEFE